jgi:V-type H+-transporting ATPase subunit C
MPSDQSTWLIAVPNDGDSEGVLPELGQKLAHQSKSFPRENLASLAIPTFKVPFASILCHACPNKLQTGTLDGLISLSEELPKTETTFTAVVAKIVDAMRGLLSGDAEKLAQHARINEQTLDAYLLSGWRWNDSRYNTQRSLRDIVDALVKVRPISLAHARPLILARRR